MLECIRTTHPSDMCTVLREAAGEFRVPLPLPRGTEGSPTPHHMLRCCGVAGRSGKSREAGRACLAGGSGA